MTTRSEYFYQLLQAQQAIKGNATVKRELETLIVDFLKDTATEGFEPSAPVVEIDEPALD